MTDRLQFVSWSSIGLRCPDHTVDLRKSDGTLSAVTLLQMPNGTGKTTTLLLLRAALSGMSPSGQPVWTTAEVRELRKTGGAAKTGEFTLDLLYKGNRLQFRLTFDFVAGTCAFTTSSIERGGQNPGFHPPRALQKFLCPEFVKFFVFDGELAANLLNKEHVRAEQAIDALFQVYLFETFADHMGKQLTKRQEELAAKSQGAGQSMTEKGLSKWTNWRDEIEGRIKELEKERARLAKRLTGLQNELKALLDQDEKAIAEVETEAREKAILEEEDKELAASYASVTMRLLTQVRRPFALNRSVADGILLFKNSLDRARLPESTAREFFEELAGEEECICGRPLDDETRAALRDRAVRYLASEEVAFLNAMKSDVVKQISPEDPGRHRHNLDLELADFRQIEDAQHDVQARREALRIRALGSDPEAGARAAKIRELEAEQKQIMETKEELEEPARGIFDMTNFRACRSLPTLKKLYDRADQEVERISDSVTLGKKCRRIKAVLSRARDNARVALSAQVVTSTNLLLDRLLPANQVRVARINRCVELQHDKAGGSMGETLSVGYAFLGSLGMSSVVSLPFIVDSPAGALDLDVRRAAGKSLPEISEQVIAFTISTEREGFLPGIRSSSASLRYLTLFRLVPGVTDNMAASAGDAVVHKSADGCVVDSEKFFMDFQLEKEETDAVSTSPRR